MSEKLIRQLLKPAPGMEHLRVPVGFQSGVGNSIVFEGDTARPPDMTLLEAQVLGRKPPELKTKRGADREAVESHAAYLSARFDKAIEAAEKIKEKAGKKKKNGEPVVVSDDEIAKPFNELIDHVRTVAVNAKGGDGGDPTILADVASALMSLDQPMREMVLRRAGNPEVFEPLRNAELAEPPAAAKAREGEQSIKRMLTEERARGAVDTDDRQLDAASKVSALPAVKRPSSVFALPDSMNSRVSKASGKAEITPSSDQYKKFLPRDHSPLNVTADDAKTTQAGAIRRLAGDSLADIRKIQNNILRERGYTDEEIKSLPASKRAEMFPMQGDAKSHTEPLPSGITPQMLTRNTDPNYWHPSDRQKNTPLNLNVTVDRTLANRNRGTYDKVLEMLYKMTNPEPVRDASTGALVSNRADGTPAAFAEPHDTVVDLDRFFPWWRGRFAVGDKDGNLSYPAALPSPEFVTGMIEGMYKVQNPQFFDRMLPLIKRSIDAAPDTPAPDARPFHGGRTAQEYSQMVFLPSQQFAETMKGGVGSRDMPYSIYGPRAVERPEVTAPERHPFQQAMQEFNAQGDAAANELRQRMQGGAAPMAPDASDADQDAAVQELRRLMGGTPGLGDQSSIYRMQPTSPLRSLIA